MFSDARGLLFELEIKSVAQQEIEFVEARLAHRDLISALILLLMILITGLLGWVWVGFINKYDEIIGLWIWNRLEYQVVTTKQ